ncbi:MAG: glycosidase [Melioribacteraceae bacterium]|nr:glycosidase [Melioribacteraceae bacterium]
MSFNPSIYEINTRVWIKQFDNGKKKPELLDVPIAYWKELKAKGIDMIWLMGIWETCTSTVEKYCFEENLVKEYKRTLKNWKKEDVIGSPYAINNYNINPAFGSIDDFKKFKKVINDLEFKLILDFIPNHFSADTELLKTNPEIFLSADYQYYLDDPHTFYNPFQDEKMIFAHGRDPFFPAWQDTVQVNYFSENARKFMTETLFDLTELCDGVRCDMAMLALNNVFKNTWGGVLKKMGFNKPEEEFWSSAISKVKSKSSDFLFLAEVYWELEWELQQLGFDYTYDKKLTDRIRVGDVDEIKEHLAANSLYQSKSIRFIENHDEQRSLTLFGKEKAKAAAFLMSTLTGMKLYFDGQFEGKTVKLPVQLGREPQQHINKCIVNFYDKLLVICSAEIFKKGEWKLLYPESSWNGNLSYKNLLAWEWSYENERRLVIINFSDHTSSCRLKLSLDDFPDQIQMIDLVEDELYIRSKEDIETIGLYVELDLFKSHIFSYSL